MNPMDSIHFQTMHDNSTLVLNGETTQEPPPYDIRRRESVPVKVWALLYLKPIMLDTGYVVGQLTIETCDIECPGPVVG